MKPAPSINLNRFDELSDGSRDSLLELIALYLTQTSQQLQDLDQAIQDKAAATVSRLAHSLLGSHRMMGLEGVVPVLRQLETAADTGNLENAPEHFKDLRAFYHEIQKELTKKEKSFPETAS